MSVTSVEKDFDSLTMTLVAEFDAAVEQVWDLWADPRRLERWWGPPGWPATFVRHELAPQGETRYFMTGPDGSTSRGWWRIEHVSPPREIDLTDGWAHEDGTPNPDAPTSSIRVRLGDRDGGGTRMVIRSTFSSREHMRQIVDLGAVEAFTASVDQMDAILGED